MIDPKMTIEDYHKHPAFGSSDLKLALRSPLHMASNRSEPRTVTESMRIGQAAHTLLLEPNEFLKRFFEMPKFEGEGSRKARAAFLDSTSHMTALSKDEIRRASGAFNAVSNHPLAKELLFNTKREESYFANSGAFDLHLKCRPDALSPDGIIIDLKTCQDASPDGFKSQVARFKYHLQAALYLDILRREGVHASAFYFIAVETEAPFGVGIYALSEEAIEKGRELYFEALARIRLSIDNPQDYLSYSPIAQYLYLPKWALNE